MKSKEYDVFFNGQFIGSVEDGKEFIAKLKRKKKRRETS